MFKREFKINFKSLLIWTLVLGGVYALVYLLYPSIINDKTASGLQEILNTMPKEFISAFNMDLMGMDSAYGWFLTEGYVFLLLLGGLYSALLGSNILLKEDNDKTIEFLLSKPVRRRTIITSKVLCGVVNILLFTGIITLVNYVFLYNSKGFESDICLMTNIIPLLLYLMLFFITLFISTFMKKTKKSMTLSAGVVFGAYIMQLIGTMGKSVEFLKDISLFEFSSSRYIIVNKAFDTKYILIGLAIIIVCIIGTYANFYKKEVK